MKFTKLFLIFFCTIVVAGCSNAKDSKKSGDASKNDCASNVDIPSEVSGTTADADSGDSVDAAGDVTPVKD